MDGLRTINGFDEGVWHPIVRRVSQAEKRLKRIDFAGELLVMYGYEL
jgi:hypothetical protein